MVIWFYFLWGIAIFKLFFGSTLKVATKLLWVMVIIFGIWLITGALFYRAHYAAYIYNQEMFEKQRNQFEDERKKLETLVQSHPTSRDVNLRLAALSYQSGERENLLYFVAKLHDIDPNNDQVKKLFKTIQ